MTNSIPKTVLLAGLCALAIVAAPVSADMVDLTTAGAQGTINDAIFEQIDPQATGTGSINSFVQVFGNTDVIEAYNTTVNNVLDNGASDQFNREILLSDVPLVTLDSVEYRRFMLDINAAANAPLLSLDEIQIFRSSTPNQSVTTFTNDILDLADADLVYRLDGPVDNHILLNYSLNSGSGSGDMFAYIPELFFQGASGDYVYLYSRFGENNPHTAGFQEWSAPLDESNNIVPEPATALLMVTGIAGMVLRRTRSR
jgi:hypothetical protein